MNLEVFPFDMLTFNVPENHRSLIQPLFSIGFLKTSKSFKNSQGGITNVFYVVE